MTRQPLPKPLEGNPVHLRVIGPGLIFSPRSLLQFPRPSTVFSPLAATKTTNQSTKSNRLRREVNAQIALERRQALRSLLTDPLLPAGGPRAEVYRLVRRHQEYLQNWFAHWPGWTLRVQPGLARLEKTASSDDDATRGAVDPTNRIPFSRRRYALFCLTLSVLCHEERQTTLRQIAERLASSVRMDPRLSTADFELDLRTQPHRRDLVGVMRLLTNYQILTRLDGDDAQYLRGDGDCLFRVDHALASATLCISRGPSMIEQTDLQQRIEAIHATSRPDGEEPRTRELQYRLVRRLLDDAVVYEDDLTEHEIEYLRHQRTRLLQEIESATGLTAEVRREGIAMLDVDGDLSDFRLPEQGTRGHAVLLVAEWLAGRQDASPAGTILLSTLTDHIRGLADEHQSHWRKGVTDPDGVEQLTDEVVRIMESLRLILLRGDRIVPLPAIARYRLAQSEDAAVPAERQRSLL